MSCEVFSLTTWLLEPPEKPSIAIATAVQFKTFYRTCSAMRVLLMAGLVGLSTSDRILTSYVNLATRGSTAALWGTRLASSAPHRHPTGPPLVHPWGCALAFLALGACLLEIMKRSLPCLHQGGIGLGGELQQATPLHDGREAQELRLLGRE